MARLVISIPRGAVIAREPRVVGVEGVVDLLKGIKTNADVPAEWEVCPEAYKGCRGAKHLRTFNGICSAGEGVYENCINQLEGVRIG